MSDQVRECDEKTRLCKSSIACDRRVRNGEAEVDVSCDVPFVADFALIFLLNSVGKRLCSLCDVLIVDLNR